MIIYWVLWVIYVLVLGVMATAGPMLNDSNLYYRTTGNNPSKLFLLGRFLMYLPFSIFGQITSPLPLLLLIVGLIISFVF